MYNYELSIPKLVEFLEFAYFQTNEVVSELKDADMPEEASRFESQKRTLISYMDALVGCAEVTLCEDNNNVLLLKVQDLDERHTII